MPSTALRPARRAMRLAPVLLAATALLAGCSQESPSGTEAKPSPSVTPGAQSAAEVAYLKCLEKNGVKLTRSEGGLLRVDKDAGDAAAAEAAESACAAEKPKPGEDGAAPSLDAAALAEQKRVTRCMRDEGFADYPEVDPATGERDVPAELAADLKSAEGVAAIQKCVGTTGGASDGGGTVQGG